MGKGLGYFTNYPKHVFLILGNEFCERFSFYGMKAILVIFFTRAWNYSDNTATAVYHAFNCICYFLPVLGAILADGYLGKFRTILYLSFVYVLGNLTVSLAAIPTGDSYQQWATYVGLVLIAIGTGGIKPCVSAFGADQFSPDQTRQKQTFFSMFYMSINLGSFLSTIITPMLRTSVQCYGGDCYPLAYGIPACLMAVSVVFFVAGSGMYKKTPPGESIIKRLFGCVGTALKGMCCKKGESKPHWLDHAEEKYGREFVKDVKAVMRVLFMFIPLPVFWALYDQQGSRWILQAGQMNGDFGNFVMQPDQMHAINPILVVIMVPLVESLLFPCLNKLKIPNSPLQRLASGLFLCALSFAVTGGLQVVIENNQPAKVPNGEVRLHYINASPCKLTGHQSIISNQHFEIQYEGKMPYFDMDKSEMIDMTVNFTECKFGKRDMFNTAFKLANLTREKGYTIIFSYETTASITEHPQKKTDRTMKGESTLNILSVAETGEIRLKYDEETIKNLTALGPAESFTWPHEKFSLYGRLFPLDTFQPIGTIQSKNGGVYTVVIQYGEDADGTKKLKLVQHEEVDSNNINIFLQFPQYIIMAFGEVLFSVTGLSFAYAEAPPSMKAVLQAGWLMTNAVGNLIVVIVSGAGIPNQIAEYFFFSGLMLLTFFIFIVMSLFYTYVSELPPDEEDDDKKPPIDGVVNATFDSDTAIGKAKEAEMNVTDPDEPPPRYDQISNNYDDIYENDVMENTSF